MHLEKCCHDSGSSACILRPENDEKGQDMTLQIEKFRFRAINAVRDGDTQKSNQESNIQ